MSLRGFIHHIISPYIPLTHSAWRVMTLLWICVTTLILLHTKFYPESQSMRIVVVCESFTFKRQNQEKPKEKWTRQQIMGEDFSSQLIFILGGLLSFINISPLAMWPVAMSELLLWLSTHRLLLILSMRGVRVGSGGIAIYHDFRNVTLLLVVDRKDDDGDSGRRMSRY